MRWRVMQWGSEAEVLEAKELSEWVKKEVERMVKRYEERGSEVGIEKMDSVWADEINRKIEKNVPPTYIGSN